MAKQRKWKYDKEHIKRVVQLFAENEPPVAFPLKMFRSLEELDKCLFWAVKQAEDEFYDNFSFQRIALSPDVIVYKLYLSFDSIDYPAWFASIELRGFGKEMTELVNQVANIGVREFFLICQLWWETIEGQSILAEEITSLFETESIKLISPQRYVALGQDPITQDELDYRPPTKDEGGTIDPWLDWYHDMKAKKRKLTLKDVADRSGWSHGYVKYRNMIHQPKPNQNITKG